MEVSNIVNPRTLLPEEVRSGTNTSMELRKDLELAKKSIFERASTNEKFEGSGYGIIEDNWNSLY